MNVLQAILFALFVVSVIVPVYTYAVYPMLLRLVCDKRYKKKDITLAVSIIVLNGTKIEIEKKTTNLLNLDYPQDKLEILESTRESLNMFVSSARGEIILFTDAVTNMDSQAVKRLIQNFADERVGTACGQLRKAGGDEGAYWKYENFVKRQESKIGRLSGANDAIFAMRKECVPDVPDDIKLLDFYLATCALEAGWDEVLDETAVAYEISNDGSFQKHVQLGIGYYQALRIFWRMLLPRKGSFTYVSHRVMKWLVPWNMVVALMSSGVLAFLIPSWLCVFVIQTLLYMAAGIFAVRSDKKYPCTWGRLGKLLEMWSYFVELNFALICGSLYKIIGVIKYENMSCNKHT